MNTHTIQYGDSLTPVGLRLKRRNTSGVLTALDLTGLTVKVLIVQLNGAPVVGETETGVTVTSEADGEMTYLFPTDDQALEPGTYWLYVRVYSGAERDTYPVEPKQMRIVVKQHAQEGTS